jgi:hypothetical protein
VLHGGKDGVGDWGDIGPRLGHVGEVGALLDPQANVWENRGAAELQQVSDVSLDGYEDLAWELL